MNARQFADLSGRAVSKPGFSLAKAALTVLSVSLLAVVIAVIGVGVWLVAAVGSIVPDVIGVVVICVGIMLLPRFGRLGKYAETVDPSELPTLNRLIDDVASAINAPRPRTLIFDARFNAGSGSYGLLRRRFMVIGLPLWLSLTPAEQVALIGHELGHFVNGDVRRLPLTSFAFSLFGRLSAMTRPDQGRSRYSRGVGITTGGGGGSSMAILGDLIVRPVMWVASTIFGLCDVLVEWLGMRASHHAEYSADALAVRAAGSLDATGMLDALLRNDVCMTVLQRAVRAGSDPAVWRREVQVALANSTGHRDSLRQLSMRDHASLFRSHPPTGLRARLIESRPAAPLAVILTDDDMAQIDRELASKYRSMKTDLANA